MPQDDDELTRRGDRRAQRVEAGRRRRRRRWLTLAGVVASVLVVGLIAVYVRFTGNIDRIDVSDMLGDDRPTASGDVTTGPLNILLIGSDVRQGEGNEDYGTGDWEPGQHSDTNLLMHIAADRSSVTMVSIPRDSMVPAPVGCDARAPKGQWKVRQWNQNYNTGGPGCLIRTIEGNTDIFVNHFAVVDFGGFKDMVDALGGVPVCTPVRIDDPKAELVLSAGRHRLDGEQALGYVRTRYTLGDGSDLGRIKRQQAFMSSVAQEATRSSLLLRPDRLLRFLDAATRSLSTDPDFGLGQMRDVAESVRGIGVDKIQFVTVPTQPYPADANRVQWAPAAAALWAAIREDRDLGTRTPTPSPTDTSPLTVAPDRISVEVVNASGSIGLAKQAVAALQVQGFAGPTSVNSDVPARGVTVEYSGAGREAARTVAAAFPGATLKATTQDLAGRVRVTLGAGAPAVVEVPNRLGSVPLPTPTVSATPSASQLETRTADDDICA